MKLVIIESPLGTNADGTRCTEEQFKRNQEYVLACMLDSLRRGEIPFASHALYPLVLKDADPDERKLGMEAGFSIAKAFKHANDCLREYDENGFLADKTTAISAVYHDRGISSGMAEGVKRNGLLVEFRLLGGDWSK